MNSILGLIGLIGGILCAVADIFLDLKGKGNKKVGKYRIIDSNWVRMALWRFPLSIMIAAVAVPMYYMGIVAISRQLLQSSVLLATLFGASGTIGAIGGLFIHATLCYFPIIYKRLHRENQCALAEDLINDIFDPIKVPYITLFVLLTIVTSIILIIAIATGVLTTSWVFIILNPFGLLLVGFLFRLINPVLFADLPGIVMPSIGLGMFGLAAFMNTLG